MKRALTEITNILPKNIKLTIHKSNKRLKLFRWLFEVVQDFKYKPETYIRTVITIDKYLNSNTRKENIGNELNLQLLGISALFISAKIDEKNIRPVSEYSEVTDFAFSVEMIVKTERILLEHFGYCFEFVMPQQYLGQKWAKISVSRERQNLNAIKIKYKNKKKNIACKNEEYRNYLSSDIDKNNNCLKHEQEKSALSCNYCDNTRYLSTSNISKKSVEVHDDIKIKVGFINKSGTYMNIKNKINSNQNYIKKNDKIIEKNKLDTIDYSFTNPDYSLYENQNQNYSIDTFKKINDEIVDLQDGLNRKLKIDLLLYCICYILEKEEKNMYYVFSMADKLCDRILEKGDYREIYFYIEKSGRLIDELRRLNPKLN